MPGNRPTPVYPPNDGELMELEALYGTGGSILYRGRARQSSRATWLARAGRVRTMHGAADSHADARRRS
eukprot:4638592-Pyramimonas_sp.AAC.1